MPRGAEKLEGAAIQRMGYYLIVILCSDLCLCRTVQRIAVPGRSERVVPPQRDVQLIVMRPTIEPGARLPEHEHPYQRYGYVLSGHLKVTMTATGQNFTYGPGAFIVEMRNQWHSPIRSATSRSGCW
jgi:quercetin dioxygenase-like cupin family protein